MSQQQRAHEAMLAALRRQVENINRWLETGVPADAEESRSIYDQMVAAIAAATNSTQEEA